MWAVSNAGNPVNLKNMSSLAAEQDGSNYIINAYDVDGDLVARLNGTWSALADARAAAARIVDAIDPVDYA
jgi:hypothetical protein